MGAVLLELGIWKATPREREGFFHFNKPPESLSLPTSIILTCFLGRVQFLKPAPELEVVLIVRLQTSQNN
jgi:hypothetical protein